MLDSLNLQQMIEEVKVQERRVQRATLILGMVIVAVVIIGGWLLLQNRTTSAGGLFYYDGRQSEWVPNEGVPHTPLKVEVAENGDIWVQLQSADGLLHYNRTVFDIFRREQFGTESGKLAGGFVLDGDEVWGATEDAVIHFDGQSWTAYPEAVPEGSRPAMLAINDAGVYLATEDGALMQFDGENWTESELPGGDALPTALYGLSDRLWLSQGGLWRYRDSAWSRVQPAGLDFDETTHLLGLETGSAWVLHQGILYNLDTNQTVVTSYKLDSFGLPPTANVTDFNPSGGRLWIATDQGDVAINLSNGDITPIKSPTGSDPEAYTTSIAFESNGVPLATRVNFDLLAQAVDQTDILLILFAVLFTLFFAYILTLQMSRLPLMRRAHNLLRETLPDMPVRRVIHISPRVIVEYYIVFMLFFVGNLVLRNGRLSSQPTQTILLLIGAIIGVIALMWLWRFRKNYGLLSTEEQSHLRSRYLMAALFVVLYSAVLYAIIDLTFSSEESIIIALVAIVIVTVLTDLAFGGWQRIARRILYRRIYDTAMNQGNYDDALARVARWRKRLPNSPLIMGVEATILGYAGRYAEEEKVWRQAITEMQNDAPPVISVVLSDLARAVYNQGRYDEALPLLETAIRIAPQTGQSYARLAVSYMNQGIAPERALTLMEHALEYTPSAAYWNNRRALVRGDYAVALAMNSQLESAGTQIETAQNEISAKFQPGLARLAYLTGHLHLIQKQNEAARQTFKRAVELDAAGGAGQMARAMLESLPAH